MNEIHDPETCTPHLLRSNIVVRSLCFFPLYKELGVGVGSNSKGSFSEA